MERVRVGLVGCGTIATRAYLPEIARMPRAALVAVCDAVEARVRDAATKYEVPHAYTDLNAMLTDGGLDLLVDTTHIQAHYEVNLAALRAGLHVYTEKPLAGTVAEADTLIAEAHARGLRLGAAAATMLDPINRKIRQLIDAGAIGTVSLAMSHNSHGGAAALLGFEWPTDPTWFYQRGAGPVVDLGVYGLHTLTGLLGPAQAVSCRSGISVPRRVARTGPYRGKAIDVEVDDNTIITLDFGGATFGVVDATYCVRASKGPAMQIFGSEGTIAVHPRGSAHPLSVYRDDAARDLYGWMDLDLRSDVRPHSLPRGVEHLIDAILDPAVPVVTSGEHARHVLEIMTKCYEAAQSGCTLPLETTF